MAKKQAPRSPSKTIEWSGGITRLSTAMDIGGVSIQPEILLWINEKAEVVGYDMGAPGKMIDMAYASISEAMAKPTNVKTGKPQRLRVSSPELAEALGKLQPRIEVVCAPTPQVDLVFKLFEKHLSEDPPAPAPKRSSPQVGVITQAALVHATVELQKLKPWKVIPDSHNAITVTVEQCDFRGGVLSLYSSDGRSFTVGLFAGRDDFDAMLAYEEEVEREERESEGMSEEDFESEAWANRPRLELPPCLSLSFDPASDGYFGFMVYQKDAPVRAPTHKEMILMEAVLLALPGILKEKQQLQAAWQSGASFSRKISAVTHAGEVEVIMSAP
jgi:hypothetical protein